MFKSDILSTASIIVLVLITTSVFVSFGESVEIGFNNRYLLDALKNADTDEIKLILNGSLTAMIVKPVKGDSYLSIFVPMRLANEN